MRQCFYCWRWFKNKQAVRRHLGFCKGWLAHKAGEDTSQEQPPAKRRVIQSPSWHCTGRCHERTYENYLDGFCDERFRCKLSFLDGTDCNGTWVRDDPDDT